MWKSAYLHSRWVGRTEGHNGEEEPAV
jgi:hypothetical protein